MSDRSFSLIRQEHQLSGHCLRNSHRVRNQRFFHNFFSHSGSNHSAQISPTWLPPSLASENFSKIYRFFPVPLSITKIYQFSKIRISSGGTSYENPAACRAGHIPESQPRIVRRTLTITTSRLQLKVLCHVILPDTPPPAPPSRTSPPSPARRSRGS